jgi:acetyl esterase/lipase
LDGHCGSYTNLLAGYTEEAREELLKTLNLNQAVTKDTPPAYIWTTANDEIVPCVNSLHYAEALAKAGVEYELHVYPRGPHGGATGKQDINPCYPELVDIRNWIADCSRFFRMYTIEKM